MVQNTSKKEFSRRMHLYRSWGRCDKTLPFQAGLWRQLIKYLLGKDSFFISVHTHFLFYYCYSKTFLQKTHCNGPLSEMLPWSKSLLLFNAKIPPSQISLNSKLQEHNSPRPWLEPYCKESGISNSPEAIIKSIFNMVN